MWDIVRRKNLYKSKISKQTKKWLKDFKFECLYVSLFVWIMIATVKLKYQFSEIFFPLRRRISELSILNFPNSSWYLTQYGAFLFNENFKNGKIFFRRTWRIFLRWWKVCPTLSDKVLIKSLRWFKKRVMKL